MQNVYSGMIPELKRMTVNLDLLFNTKARNKNGQTTSFQTRIAAKINRGSGAIASCNGIPINCNAADIFEITAQDPFSVNEIFHDCSFKDLTPEEIMSIYTATTAEMAVYEATYGYSKQTPLITDITAEMAADTTITTTTDEIVYAIKKLTTNGYSRRDLIVALDEGIATEFAMQDLECCDYGIQSRDPQEVRTNLAKKLGVMAVVDVPTSVLSGHFEFKENGTNETPLTPETTVKFRVYVKDYSMLTDYCKDEIIMRDVTDKGYAGNVTQIIGAEYLGFGVYDTNNSGVFAYMAEPAAPPVAEGV